MVAFTIAARDGSAIEFGYGCDNGVPGTRCGGQHHGRSTSWYRIPGGEWECHRRSMHWLKSIAEVSDSAEEFVQLVEME